MVNFRITESTSSYNVSYNFCHFTVDLITLQFPLMSTQVWQCILQHCFFGLTVICIIYNHLCTINISFCIPLQLFFFYLLDEKPLWCNGLCVCMQRKMCPTYPPVMKCIETHTDRIYYTRDVFATRHVFHFVGISKNKTQKNQTNWKQHLIIQSQLDPKLLFHHK